MSEQRIDTGADAATGTDADQGEGLGLTDHGDPLNPAGSAGGDADMPQPTADRPGGGTADTADSAETEGASHLRDTEANQGGTPDLSGREPAGERSGWGDGTTGNTNATTGDGSVGEVSSAPREERRREDPGSAGREFGDRADEAPDDEIAHPSI
jgi:hypothetical protein